jgi:hypothetical protein
MGIVGMDKTADKNFFSFRIFLTIFYWIIGTAMMILSVYTDVSIFWGLAVIIAGTILLIANVLDKDNNDCK